MRGNGYIPISFYRFVPFGQMRASVLLANLCWAHDIKYEELSVKSGVPMIKIKLILRDVVENLPAVQVRKLCRVLDCRESFFVDAIEESLRLQK